MSYSTADSFIDFCRFHFDQIENIVFFGGEPLLNIKIIDYVCNSFESLYEKGKINKMPSFGIITNGTIMNSSILKILIKHIKFITISIDGPEKLMMQIESFLTVKEVMKNNFIYKYHSQK